MALINPLDFLGDQRATVRLVGIAPLLLMAGCSTTMKEVMPADNPSMLEIYRNHNDDTTGDAGAELRADIIRPVAGGNGDQRDYTRTAGNEIDDLFPRLANPDMVMYVFPHLAGSGVPVPGYSTVFPMYADVEYALPGEGNY